MTAHFWSNSGIVAVSDDTNNNPLNLKRVFRLKLPTTNKTQPQQNTAKAMHNAVNLRMHDCPHTFGSFGAISPTAGA